MGRICRSKLLDVDGPEAHRGMLVTGPRCGSKLEIVALLGAYYAARQKKVAMTSTSPFRATLLEGNLLHSFLGLRSPVYMLAMLSTDQLADSIERHARLTSTVFCKAFPTVETIDVLVIDGLHDVPPNVLAAIDQAARKLRHDARFFGGIKIISSADFFSLRNVSPSSPNNGYLFQMKHFRDMFEVFLTPSLNQNAKMGELTWAALLGCLSREQAKAFIDGRHAQVTNHFLDFQDHVPIVPTSACKHRCTVTTPVPQSMMQTMFGSTLLKQLHGVSNNWAFALSPNLCTDPGAFMMLTLDMYKNGKLLLPRGSVGTVTESGVHSVSVKFAQLAQVVEVLPLRVDCFVEQYPNVVVTTQQLPLVACRTTSCIHLLQNIPLPPPGIHGQALFTETNSIGNTLALFDAPQRVAIPGSQICDVLRTDGMVHEPTAIFYERLLREQAPALYDVIAPQLFADRVNGRWCKNCKTHVDDAEFDSHWDRCVESARFCTDTNKIIPLHKWPSHYERHTVVLCFDCGQSFKWGLWEQHRLSCPGMLKELSAENPLLPVSTRHMVVELVHARDLSGVKEISKASLPKSVSDVREPKLKAKSV